MRNLVLFAVPLAVACAANTPPPIESGPYTCRETGLDRFIGQPASVDVAAEILRESGARTFRWTGPGIAVTMDLRTDRVNAQLDESLSRIVGVSCA